MSKAASKNITIFLPRLHNNFRPLINGLLKNNYKVSVLVMRAGKIEDHSKVNYVKAKRYSLTGKKLTNNDEIRKFEFISVFDVIKYFNENRPRYLLIRNDTTLAFLTILVVGKINKCKIIFYNQYPYFDQKISRNIYNLFLYKIFKIPSITPVLNSKLDFKYIAKYESATQYKNRLHNFLRDTPSSNGKIWFPFSTEKNSSNKPKTNRIKILTVGKFEERKNLDLVIKYMSEICKNDSQMYELTIVGELESKHLNYFNFINRLKSISETKNLIINIHSNISRPKIMNLYSNSHYFFLLSEKEICSVSQLEAYMHNCKLIINYDNGNLDFLPIHKNYYIVTNLREFILDPRRLKFDNKTIKMDNYICQYNEIFGVNSQVQRIKNLFEMN
jgi:glycosyltransferase involved in cell wall biosynthesis